MEEATFVEVVHPAKSTCEDGERQRKYTSAVTEVGEGLVFAHGGVVAVEYNQVVYTGAVDDRPRLVLSAGTEG